MNISVNVIPTQSVGSIRFGMMREDVRTAVGSTCTEFRKSKFSKNTSDDFGFMHVFYDEKNTCEAVELFNDCTVTVDDVCLMPSDKVRVDAWLKERDASVELLPCDSISKTLAIGVAASEGRVESVIFGRAGYYD